MSEVDSALISFFDQSGKFVADLKLFPETLNTLYTISDEEMQEYGEAQVQLLEGMAYEFEVKKQHLVLSEQRPIIRRSSLNKSAGRITPGLHVGRLKLTLQDKEGVIAGWGEVEVRSRKVSYRGDYRQMLEYITDQTVDLLHEIRSPSHMSLLPDPGKSPETIAQRFAFISSLLTRRQFHDAIQRLTMNPHCCCEPFEHISETQKGFRGSAFVSRQLAEGGHRLPLSNDHPLHSKIPSLPRYVVLQLNQETIDTAENQFIKYVLNRFVKFLSQILERLKTLGRSADNRLKSEVGSLKEKLEAILRREFFRDISELRFIPIGSPVLQRKEGYRQILKSWLKFDMAARLVWSGGEDVYMAGKRDVAVLYEYWVFFKLINIVCQIFNVKNPLSHELLEKTGDGFGLKLKTGQFLSVNGIYSKSGRSVAVRFSYNRTFSRKGIAGQEKNYPSPGTWTEAMRPDYTLSLWPSAFSEKDAEEQELIVHLHFDAKYRLNKIKDVFGMDDADVFEQEDCLTKELNNEKQEQRGGKYKRADLLKMHAYRDAIRRTAGAYIIYPGHLNRNWRGFHEILPGLGAFGLRPSDKIEDGTGELSDFIRDVIEHICNRSSQRETHSFHVYSVHNHQQQFFISKPYPEKEKQHRRHSPPAETSVLVGWYKDSRHYDWIVKRGKYNFRMDTARGSLRLDPGVTGSKYLLLHTWGNKSINGLLKIKTVGPRVFSKQKLMEMGYPDTPNHDYYLVFDIENDPSFEMYSWDYQLLQGRPKFRGAALPFSVTLEQLMQVARKLI